MVKQQKKINRKKQSSKGSTANSSKAGKINASTEYETCDEQLIPFGGLLAVIKFKEIFNYAYQRPSRKPKLGHYSMVVSILMTGRI